MPTFSNNWFQYTVDYWRALFEQLGWLDGRVLTAVEVGSFEGQSTLWILENLLRHPEGRIHCLDTFTGGVDHTATEAQALRERFDRNILESGNAEKVIVHPGLSRRGLVDLLSQGVTADFIYLDGSHQASDVLEDLVLSFRILKIGGLVICDDYLWFMESRHADSSAAVDLLNAPKMAIDAFVNINIRKIRIPQKQPLYQLAFLKTAD